MNTPPGSIACRKTRVNALLSLATLPRKRGRDKRSHCPSDTPALMVFAGASSTFLQAGGRSASIKGFGGLPPVFFFGCSTLSENQKARSFSPHPALSGTDGCLRQFGESAGHFSRTWIWSWWPYQGRTLSIQSGCLSPWIRQISFLIAAFTST